MSFNIINYYQNGKIIESIQFPKTEVGKTSTIKIMIENTLAHHVELDPMISDKDVVIEKYPKELRGGEIQEAIISFKPNINRLIPLTDEISFKVTIG